MNNKILKYLLSNIFRKRMETNEILGVPIKFAEKVHLNISERKIDRRFAPKLKLNRIFGVFEKNQNFDEFIFLRESHLN